MAIKIISSSARISIYLNGEIDHHNAAVIRYEADEAIQASMPKTVRIDFSNVSFMDSSGIGFVMGRFRLVNGYGGKVEVVGLSERLYSMMKLAGLEKLVKLEKKQEKGK
ncbi:MAG: STAS domain-containing protein [Clostridia bacterium]|nr:STAS domain-containing protein [Clostridia bacterium]